MKTKRTYRSKNVLQTIQEITRDYKKIFEMNILRMDDESYKIIVEGNLDLAQEEN